MTLIFLCLGWLAGIYLGLASGAGAGRSVLLEQTWPALAALAVLALLASLLARGDRRLSLTALVLACAILGVWRAFGALPDPAPAGLPAGSSTVQGVIVDRPEPRDAALLFVLDVDRVKTGSGWDPSHLRILVRTDRYQEWSYGDAVSATGEIRPVSGTGYWADALRRQGVYSTMEYARLQRLESPSGSDPIRFVNGIRDRLQQLCQLLLPEPQASLLAGVLVGGRAGMPKGFQDALNATSTSHVVAVSGFNVTVVAGAVQLLALRFLSRRKAVLVAMAAVWGYTLLTGFPPSAVRAAIMGTMALGSVLVGRDSDALAFLILSGAVMSVVDPLLIFDLGFQLSFLATAGLILLEPVLRGWISRLPGPLGRLPGWLVSSFTVTLAAQLATLPLLATTFHTVSIISPATNLLIAPALTGLMGFGAAAVGLGAIAEVLGRMAAPLAWVYLTYMVQVVERTAALPAASVSVGAAGPLQIALYYSALLGMAIWPLPELRAARCAVAAGFARFPRWAMLASLAAGLSVTALGLSERPDGRLHVYFLDVGEGDATLIRSPQGHMILVDGGPSPVALESELGSRLGLTDRGLDGIVLTGYDQDRMAGMLEVARRHPVSFVLQPDTPVGSRAAVAWAELTAEKQIQAVRAEAGQRIDLGEGSYLEVVWASGRDSKDPRLALRLVSGRVSVLLPGDLPPGAQREFGGRADVLMVPRQGAAGALDPLFVQRNGPAVAVLPVGDGNRFGHPSDATLAMLKDATVFRTDRHGTVELAIDGNGYELYTER